MNNGEKRLFRLATVTSTSGGVSVLQFDGETAPSAKKYKRLSSYTPAVGDRVLMAEIAGTYVILGKIV